jgi:hypothetical protein
MQLLSREAEGPALRSLGNPAAASDDANRSATGAKSGRHVLEDERLLGFAFCYPLILPAERVFVSIFALQYNQNEEKDQ